MGVQKSLGSEDRDAVLLQRLKTRGGSPEAGAIRPHGTAGAPLSFGQERMWLVEQLAPDTSVNNFAYVYRLRGELSVEALGAAVCELERRHEVLRTVYDTTGESVTQRVLDEPGGLGRSDLSRRPDPPAAAYERARELAAEPYRLSEKRPIRWELARIGRQDHLLIQCLHHAVADGWSERLLKRELSRLYEAFLEPDAVSPPPPPAVQYADFAHWQRQREGGEAAAEHRRYWTSHLRDAPTTVRLPFDRKPDAESGYEGETLTFDLPAEPVARARELARAQGCSLFMVLLAAFALLLHRRGAEDDLVLGVPVAGRPRPELEELIGFFVNTLGLRIDLSEDPSFEELLGRVRTSVLDGMAHQATPLERLVEEMQPTRDPGRQPLVQVLFQLHNPPQGELRLPGVEVEEEQLFQDGASLDLSVSFVEDGAGIRGHWGYRKALFDRRTVERLHQAYAEVLAHAVVDPGRRLSAFPALTAEERDCVVHRRNDTDRPYTFEALPGLFEAQVRRTPDAVAVVESSRSTSFEELNRRANRIAHLLRARNVGPESIVAILLDRSTEQVAATLGVSKAGGAFLALDAKSPDRRIAFMLRDAAPTVVITDGILAPRVPQTLDAEVLCVDQPLPPAHDSDPERVVDPDQLAYVIYTSGTTGEPKGTALTHRGLSNYLSGAADYERGGREGSPVHSPLSFDFTVTPLLLPLLTGRHIELLSEAHTLDHLAEVIQEPGRDFALLKLTPSHLEALRARIRPGTRIDSLHTVILGGEQLRAESLAAWRQFAPSATFLNEYGPTEAVVGCTFHEVPETTTAGPVPIGTPMANARIFLLDGDQRLVPPGMAGEVYIGGHGVARGYLGRPALTADRFVPDPYGPDPGGRLYRTGDLARWNDCGLLEYLGRCDHQVKLRGYRVELGEVENALLRHPDVRQAIAVVREDVAGDPLLVVYWEPRSDGATGTADAGALRGFLAQVLPDYMVPSALVPLDSVPLNSNGKLDQAALPRPVLGSGTDASGHRSPRDGDERCMAAIWEEILGISDIGVHDDFFALGGHSLRAARIVQRVVDAFPESSGAHLLRALFGHPTVASFTRCVTAAARGDAPTPEVVRVDRSGPVRLSSVQRRLWFLDQLAPSGSQFVVPIALGLTGPLEEGALQAAVDGLVERHEVLRTTVTVVDGEPMGSVRDPAPVHLAYTDVSGRDGDDRVDALLRAEAARPLDPESGSPLRVTLVRVGKERHLLCLTVHHMSTDAVSTGVLIDDLCAFYAAARGEGLAPEPLTVQYADLAAWQESALAEQEQGLLTYWKTALEGSTAAELPPDHARPARRSGVGASFTFTVDGDVAGRLERLGNQHGATLFMTLLAAFQLLLSRYSGHTDVTVGTTVHGREHPSAQTLVGCFINMLVLRGDLSGDPTFETLLERTRERSLAAYEHQSMPFDRLVDELQPERDMSRTPLFQVMLQLVDHSAGAGRETAGLKLREWAQTALVSKYDLTLSLERFEHGLTAELEYDTALYDRATMDRLVDHFRTLLRAVTERPGTRISRIPLLTPDGRQRMLDAAVGERSSSPPGVLHEMFSEQASRTPDAVAVTDGETQWTYRELDLHTNRIAHELAARGVGPETPVGILLDPAPETLAALLGVLKAGGAYVPIEAETPPDRVRMLLAEVRAPLCLVRPDLADLLTGTSTVALPWTSRLWWNRPGDALRRQVDPEGLAAVLFTSGSTGRPKAVACTHDGWVNRMAWMQGIAPLGSGDAVLHKTTTVFDPSAVELFWPLLHGAGVALMAPGEHRNPEAVVHAAQRFQVAHIQFVPSMLGPFLDCLEAPGGAELPALRSVGSSGEALSPQLTGRFRKRFGDRVLLLNAWGLTEASVDSTAHVCVPDDLDLPGESVPIGPPMADNEVYVLDAQREPVPVGVPGEIYIGGRGLARGYLGSPGRTAESFVPHPFRDGARLYRTGDVGRFRPDGSVAFLGRADDQVKVRGVRIELGEVESAVRSHPGVAECVVALWEPTPGDKRLAAYVTTPVSGDGKPTPAELTEHVSRRLSRYAVPSSLTVLDRLPRHPSGKLDRRALPEPVTVADETPVHTPPRTLVEATVATAWCEVLGLPALDIDADFFHAGGHSLLATRAIARMRSAFSTALPLSLVFEYPTVRSCAARVEALVLAEIEALSEDEAQRGLA